MQSNPVIVGRKLFVILMLSLTPSNCYRVIFGCYLFVFYFLVLQLSYFRENRMLVVFRQRSGIVNRETVLSSVRTSKK